VPCQQGREQRLTRTALRRERFRSSQESGRALLKTSWTWVISEQKNCETRIRRRCIATFARCVAGISTAACCMFFAVPCISPATQSMSRNCSSGGIGRTRASQQANNDGELIERLHHGRKSRREQGVLREAPQCKSHSPTESIHDLRRNVCDKEWGSVEKDLFSRGEIASAAITASQ